MNRGIRMVLAVVLIIFLYFLWIGLGSVLFGWQHGGGIIPTLLFFSLSAYVWKTITKKKEKPSKEISDTNGKEE